MSDPGNVSLASVKTGTISCRADLKDANLIVIKAGTSVVSYESGYPCISRMASIVEPAVDLAREGKQVVIVTSGAVGCGRRMLRNAGLMRHTGANGIDDQKTTLRKAHNSSQALDSIPDRQEQVSYNSACAAAGQMSLMTLYDTMFSAFDVPTSQLLVTSFDFHNEERRANVQYVISQLLSMGIVPLINENDAVSANQGYNTFGKGFSDNDSLASQVSNVMQADLLVLLTDVSGCFTAPPSMPGSQLIDVFDKKSFFLEGTKSAQGRGGMAAKVDAAMNAVQKETQACVIASGRDPDVLNSIFAGDKKGTLFLKKDHGLKEDGTPLYTETDGLSATDVIVEEGNTGGESPPIVGTAKSHVISAESVEEIAVNCRRGGRLLSCLSSEERENILNEIANEIKANKEEILARNKEDLLAAKAMGKEISAPNLKRLQLTDEKLSVLSDGIRSIAKQEEPIGALQSSMELSEGLQLDKITTPIGVLLIIFESRPDCLPQIAALAIRSGNGILLKGGKEAEKSNDILHTIIQNVIERCTNGQVPRDTISLVKSRAEISLLLSLDQYIDLIIPRGSGAMVNFIKQNTKIPVMGHAEGICHVYVDKEANIDKACSIVVDAKIDYPSACNAAECLLLNSDLLSLPSKGGNKSAAHDVVQALVESDVSIFGSERAIDTGLCSEEVLDFKTEYGNFGISVHIVDSLLEAVDHIHQYGSSHTEAIITENNATAQQFLSVVDSACVMHNASTRFADGFRFGLGAEVGISTGRIHARGPVGVEGLLTSKWILKSTSATGHYVGQFSTKVPEAKRLTYTHKAL